MGLIDVFTKNNYNVNNQGYTKDNYLVDRVLHHERNLNKEIDNNLDIKQIESEHHTMKPVINRNIDMMRSINKVVERKIENKNVLVKKNKFLDKKQEKLFDDAMIESDLNNIDI